MTTYINPLTDFGFKRIFGNREILTTFLNDILPIEHKIVDITFKNIEKLGTTEEDRKAIFDLSCKDEKGSEFIVELQRAKQIYFQDRAIYYTTFPVQEQAQRGRWDFKLSKIFFIEILDFSIPYFDDERYIRHGQIVDIESNKVMSETLNFIYIELTKFKKTNSEVANNLEKWLYILSNLSTLEDIPNEFKEDKIIENVFDIAKYSNLSTSDRDSYDRNLKHYRDLVNSLDSAEKDGIKKGIEKGRIEGKLEAKIEIAKTLLSFGDTLEKISQITGLRVEEIEKLR